MKPRIKLTAEKAQTVCFSNQYTTEAQRLENVPAAYKQNLHCLKILLLQTIDNNEAIYCSYKMFHIPYIYLICDTLCNNIHSEDTYLFCLMKDEVKRLAFLNKQQSAQFSSNFVYGVISDSLRYEMMPENYFLNKLRHFLKEFETKMSTFMPYYYEMFDFICNPSDHIKSQMKYKQIKKKFDDKHHQLHIKYHNRDLQ